VRAVFTRLVIVEQLPQGRERFRLTILSAEG
jgi:hypothetical protein